MISLNQIGWLCKWQWSFFFFFNSYTCYLLSRNYFKVYSRRTYASKNTYSTENSSFLIYSISMKNYTKYSIKILQLAHCAFFLFCLFSLVFIIRSFRFFKLLLITAKQFLSEENKNHIFFSFVKRKKNPWDNLENDDKFYTLTFQYQMFWLEINFRRRWGSSSHYSYRIQK